MILKPTNNCQSTKCLHQLHIISTPAPHKGDVGAVLGRCWGVEDGSLLLIVCSLSALNMYNPLKATDKSAPRRPSSTLPERVGTDNVFFSLIATNYSATRKKVVYLHFVTRPRFRHKQLWNRGISVREEHGEMAERSIAAVLKTVDLRGSGGSNPSLSAEKN